MAIVSLARQISLQEIIEIIKSRYPTYFCTIKGAKIIIDTGIHGKMEAYYSGSRIVVVPKVNLILAFIIGLTVIGAVMLIIAFNVNPVAKEIANTIANNVNANNIEMSSNSSIPDTCPHCKNPNAKQLRICEWCGGQIC